MTDLWTEASHDFEGELADRALTEARVATAQYTAFITSAENWEDLQNRKALIAAYLEANVPDPVVRAKVSAEMDQDWQVVQSTKKQAVLTLNDLDRALDDDRHLGYGYASMPNAGRRVVDPLVIKFANELGWNYEDLFQFANDRVGRWLGDGWDDDGVLEAQGGLEQLVYQALTRSGWFHGASKQAAPSDGQTSYCRLCGQQMEGSDYIWYGLSASSPKRDVGKHEHVPARLEARPGEFGPDGVLKPGIPGGEGGQYDAPLGTIWDGAARAIPITSKRANAADVDDVPTPGQEVADYPQPEGVDAPELKMGKTAEWVLVTTSPDGQVDVEHFPTMNEATEYAEFIYFGMDTSEARETRQEILRASDYAARGASKKANEVEGYPEDELAMDPAAMEEEESNVSYAFKQATSDVCALCGHGGDDGGDDDLYWAAWEGKAFCENAEACIYRQVDQGRRASKQAVGTMWSQEATDALMRAKDSWDELSTADLQILLDQMSLVDDSKQWERDSDSRAIKEILDVLEGRGVFASRRGSASPAPFVKSASSYVLTWTEGTDTNGQTEVIDTGSYDEMVAAWADFAKGKRGYGDQLDATKWNLVGLSAETKVHSLYFIGSGTLTIWKPGKFGSKNAYTLEDATLQAQLVLQRASNSELVGVIRMTMTDKSQNIGQVREWALAEAKRRGLTDREVWGSKISSKIAIERISDWDDALLTAELLAENIGERVFIFEVGSNGAYVVEAESTSVWGGSPVKVVNPTPEGFSMEGKTAAVDGDDYDLSVGDYVREYDGSPWSSDIGFIKAINGNQVTVVWLDPEGNSLGGGVWVDTDLKKIPLDDEPAIERSRYWGSKQGSLEYRKNSKWHDSFYDVFKDGELVGHVMKGAGPSRWDAYRPGQHEGRPGEFVGKGTTKEETGWRFFASKTGYTYRYADREVCHWCGIGIGDEKFQFFDDRFFHYPVCWDEWSVNPVNTPYTPSRKATKIASWEQISNSRATEEWQLQSGNHVAVVYKVYASWVDAPGGWSWDIHRDGFGALIGVYGGVADTKEEAMKKAEADLAEASKTARKQASSRYEAAQAIYESGEDGEIEGTPIDHQQAQLIVAVYEALSPENQARFDEPALESVVELGSKHTARKQAAWREEYHGSGYSTADGVMRWVLDEQDGYRATVVLFGPDYGKPFAEWRVTTWDGKFVTEGEERTEHKAKDAAEEAIKIRTKQARKEATGPPEPWPVGACGDQDGDTFCVLDAGHEDDHRHRSRVWVELKLDEVGAVSQEEVSETEDIPTDIEEGTTVENPTEEAQDGVVEEASQEEVAPVEEAPAEAPQEDEDEEDDKPDFLK